MNGRVERRKAAQEMCGEALSPLGLEALVAGRLREAERERFLDRLLADPAGAALLRLACALQPEAERLASDLRRTKSPPVHRHRAAGWWMPLAAAALLALLLLPRGFERGAPAETVLAGDSAAILFADFESLPGDSEPHIFASQFDG